MKHIQIFFHWKFKEKVDKTTCEKMTRYNVISNSQTINQVLKTMIKVTRMRKHTKKKQINKSNRKTSISQKADRTQS